ncbi:MAG: pilin [bacterium]|nr:pilin [bacterium]
MSSKYYKKIKIILYLPLVLLFIANLFYFSLPVEAAETCTWYPNADCTGLGTSAYVDKCKDVTKPSTCTTFGYCSCCCNTTTPSTGGVNADMPKLKMPELQISIPGLTFTKSEAIKCTEQGGKKTCNIPWIGEYIAAIYKYAIGIVGILAAVVLMIGGVMWIIAGGSATMIGEAKAWIGASLTGLVIALCSYVILYQVNPALVGFNGLNIQIVDQTPIPADLKAFSEKCKPTDNGECAVSKMTIFGDKAQQASAICMAESSGVANAKNASTKCNGGDYYAVWGLFQFNLSANYLIDADGTRLNCPDAFGNKAWVNSSPNCSITNIDLYNKCVAAASNPTIITSNAKRLAGSGWGPWEANSKWCNF